ncbi:MAG: RNA polymerase factor sigma-54 [Sulfuricella sp.]|nr:RNA polymerase factor sigma-54 [Sulfuricella sp.]
MKHSLQLKLSQHLTLTPQLQQSIRLLQMSTLEMDQELDAFAQENPFLERVEGVGDAEGGSVDADAGEGKPDEFMLQPAPTGSSADESPAEPAALTESDWDQNDSPWSAHDDEDDSDDYSLHRAEAVDLRNHLNAQLGVTQLSEHDRRIVALLIDVLNEDGYLTQNLDELAAMLPPELEIEPIELSTALRHLQNLDPPGVGARDLGECLALQLEILPPDTPYLEPALAIAKHHLNLLASRDFIKLKKLLHCNDEELRAAQRLITRLNPRPGAAFASLDTRYIQHDVEVQKVKGNWVASLNPDVMPRLRINRMYADILRRNRDSGSQHLSSQMQEARWMIKNIQQRFDTILRVSQAIVDRQRNFLEHGAVAMRPLVLREIAEAVSLHESTISRVTTQKYMRTPRGIFELKYFFGSSCATETGGACSSTAIRALIKQLVAAETPQKPLSDSQIADILAKQGIVVARRTVAKYRESMQIPAVSFRKNL